MRIRFRKVKDIAAVPMDWFLRSSVPLPGAVHRALFSVLGLTARTYYYGVPGNHLRRTLGNFCRVSKRTDRDAIFQEVLEKTFAAINMFRQLMDGGADELLARMEFDAESLMRLKAAKEQYGAGIMVVPHCAGSVLSAVRFGREFPTVVLARESKSERRAKIMRAYFEKLGSELLFVRRQDPAAVARGILRALHEKKFIIGTTDLIRKTKDTVPVRMFGEQVHMPAWPARFSARRNAPILPGYISMRNGQILLSCGKPYIEKDLACATQRWASHFEAQIRQSPSDWLFMFEKRWSKIFAAAAAKA